MATVFSVTPKGTGFGTVSGGTTESQENTISLDTYLDNDVKLPGICNQTPVWQTDSSSGFSYSQIGNHVFLKGTLSGKSSANNSTIATLGSTLAPSKNKYFTMLLRAGTGSTAAYVWAKVKLTTTGALILTNSVYVNNGSSTTPPALYGSFDIEYWR